VARRKTGRTLPQPWQPLEPAVPIITDAMREQAAKDPVVAKVLAESSEVWRNDKYVVVVRRFAAKEGERWFGAEAAGAIASLSIRRDDRKAIRDWRDLQRIKNDVAGEDVEAVELFPAEGRLVDNANQYWMWCLPPGQRFPFGFAERAVTDGDDPRFPKSKQRPLADVVRAQAQEVARRGR
jgi:hypothetical protein